MGLPSSHVHIRYDRSIRRFPLGDSQKTSVETVTVICGREFASVTVDLSHYYHRRFCCRYIRGQSRKPNHFLEPQPHTFFCQAEASWGPYFGHGQKNRKEWDGLLAKLEHDYARVQHGESQNEFSPGALDRVRSLHREHGCVVAVTLSSWRSVN